MTEESAPHFDLDQEDAYKQWRDEKLNHYPEDINQLMVLVQNPQSLTDNELKKCRQLLSKTNMLIYQWNTIAESENEQKKQLKSFAGQFGLNKLDHNECADEDAITSLQINQTGLHHYYIPYTNKAINWHTDGYYNALEQQVYAFVLHCVRPAVNGGSNQLLDPEIIYIKLRDENPNYIRALCDPKAMMIPKNIIDNKEVRPDRYGPVFMLDKNNHLHMRYSARKRNVVWKEDSLVKQAEKRLRELLESDLSYVFRAKLEPGQGVFCRNVLHSRDEFDEASHSQRLLFRGRYYEELQE